MRRNRETKWNHMRLMKEMSFCRSYHHLVRGLASDVHNKHYTNSRYTTLSILYSTYTQHMLISLRCRECITCQIVKLLNRSPRYQWPEDAYMYINCVCLHLLHLALHAKQQQYRSVHIHSSQTKTYNVWAKQHASVPAQKKIKSV